jgi:hypothetical protein
MTSAKNRLRLREKTMPSDAPKLPVVTLREAVTKAARLLHTLHPPHSIGWHSVCLTCLEIQQIEESLRGDRSAESRQDERKG